VSNSIAPFITLAAFTSFTSTFVDVDCAELLFINSMTRIKVRVRIGLGLYLPDFGYITRRVGKSNSMSAGNKFFPHPFYFRGKKLFLQSKIRFL
jgi:hypothetical protein